MRKSRLKFAVLNADHIIVPASFFGIVLGLLGLGNCWRVAVKIWHLTIITRIALGAIRLLLQGKLLPPSIPVKAA